jgi:hypothetical protein
VPAPLQQRHEHLADVAVVSCYEYPHFTDGTVWRYSYLRASLRPYQPFTSRQQVRRPASSPDPICSF